MPIRGIRGPAVVACLLALGAWAGSAVAHGTGLPSVSVSVPGVTIPAVSVTVPSATAPSATVPSVGATVQSATVNTPVSQVSAPTVQVATPSAPVVTPSPVPAPKAAAPVAAAKAATSGLPTVRKTVTKTVKAASTATAAAATRASARAAEAQAARVRAARLEAAHARAARLQTARLQAARLRAARVRAAHLRAARARAAEARRIRLERAAGERQRLLRAKRAAETPLVPDPTPVTAMPPFLDPALPVLDGVEPYPTLSDVAAGEAPPLLPISTVAAASLLPGVSVRSSSTLHAIAPPAPALEPSGGFNGASRFAMFLLMESAPVAAITPPAVDTPVISRTPLLTPVTGGRTQADVTTAGGGRGVGVDTPLGRISVSGGDYVFGSTEYPLASVRGVGTTLLVTLAALGVIAAWLAAIAAVGRLLGARARRGKERTREELYAAARRKNIPGRSRMSKAELLRALDEY